MKLPYFHFLFVFLVGFSHVAASIEITARTVNWPPFYAETLKNGGPLAEITREALKHKGHTMQLKFIPWKRALNKVRNGDHDMVLGAYDTPKRRKQFIYSESFYEVSEFVIGIRGKVPESFNKLSDLSQYTFGLTRGYAYSNDIETDKSLQRSYTSSDELNLKKLFAGRIDFVVMNEGLFYGTTSRMKLPSENAVLLSPPLNLNSLHNLFSKEKAHSKKLNQDFNEGIKAIKKSGLYEEILKKHGLLK